MAVGGVEVVAEPRQVQGDLVGDLGRADAADGGVEVAAGPGLDRVRGGETADRERHTRFLVRRERPHPGAQLSLFDTIEGRRHQVVATDTPPGTGSIQFLQARHRAHARVEDRIRCGKNTGIGRFPSRVFALNQAWLQRALTGIDLLAWTQTLLLDGDLARAEPKKLRYRLLHVAARITRTARRTRVAIAADWPWTDTLTSAFTKLATLPRPTG